MLKKISPKNRTNYLEVAKAIEKLKNNNLINSYLGNKGYSIYKVCLNTEIIDFIKDELTVKPNIINSLIEAKSFPIYQESDKKIYVPRYWGINMFGYPKTIKIQYGNTIDLKFNGVLRDYQITVLNEYLKAIGFNIEEKKIMEQGQPLSNYGLVPEKQYWPLKLLKYYKRKQLFLFINLF